MSERTNLSGHFCALFTILVWGTTMVSTKVLLREGLSPAEIMIMRFVAAYVFLWILYPHTHRIGYWRDEIIFFCLGITGGSLYFIFENSALLYTTATNVSLICALIPLMTAFFSYLILHDKQLSRYFLLGSLVSLAGAVFVILNGNFSLNFNPLGDILAFFAIISWALYGVLFKLLKGEYKTLYVTRRVFFYSIITMIPYFIFKPFDVSTEILIKPVVIGNLCFLGLIASSFCYFFWTFSLRNIGLTKTNYYLYFQPLITIVAAAIVLDEKVTFYVVCGTVLIFSGLFIATKKSFH